MPSPTQEAPAEAGAAPGRSTGPLRFSLRSLIIGVTITAIACMALRYANEIWATLCWTFLVGAVLAAGIFAIYGNPQHRPWRVGFILIATALSLICWMHPPREYPSGGGRYPGMQPEPLLFRTLTTWAYDALQSDPNAMPVQPPNPYLPQLPPPMANPEGFNSNISFSPPTVWMPVAPVNSLAKQGPSLTDILHIADPLWILLLASIGGCIAAWLETNRSNLSVSNS